MNKLTFIVGGARSGKSTLALEIAKKYKRVAFVATCQPLDKEMQYRIKLHKESRPKNWDTFEEPVNLDKLFLEMKSKYDCVIIDCLTLLVSNLMMKKKTLGEILEQVGQMITVLKAKNLKAIIVSNEVGLGIVPDNKLARDFRDIAGKVNQLVAKKSNEVFFTVSGIPMKIKGDN